MRPKVFILGAGASKPYNFPTGSELLGLIPDILFPVEQPINKYIHKNFDRNKILWLLKKLKKPYVTSIDRFLYNHRSDQEIYELGKFCIGYHIFRGEEGTNRNYINNWYQYFFNKILDIADNQYQNIIDVPIDIITFNYDRSYEWHFYNGLLNAFPIKDDLAKAISKEYFKKRVIHVHGSLGELFEWPYGSGGEFEPLLEMSKKNIRIVYEEPGGELDERFKSIFTNAVKIYFLGFGYLKENIDKLNFKIMNPNYTHMRKEIYGSCYNMKPGELSDIQKYFVSTKRQRIKFHLGNLDFSKLDVLDFIRTVVGFLD